MKDLNEIAELAFQIWETKSLPPDAAVQMESLSLADAYKVQSKVLEQRIAGGEKMVGYKVGCTSGAIRQQFGLTEPICGRLMEPCIYDDGIELDWNAYVQCAVEPEFVLQIQQDVPHDVVDERELIDVIGWVAPGIEVHHFKFWFGDPTSQELILSNGIHAALVVGSSRRTPESTAFKTQRVDVFCEEQLAASGFGADIMGGPLTSLRWLIRHLAERGEYLRAGQLVIPGSPVELVAVRPQDRITVSLTQLENVTAWFREH